VETHAPAAAGGSAVAAARESKVLQYERARRGELQPLFETRVADREGAGSRIESRHGAPTGVRDLQSAPCGAQHLVEGSSRHIRLTGSDQASSFHVRSGMRVGPFQVSEIGDILAVKPLDQPPQHFFRAVAVPGSEGSHDRPMLTEAPLEVEGCIGAPRRQIEGKQWQAESLQMALQNSVGLVSPNAPVELRVSPGVSQVVPVFSAFSHQAETVLELVV